MPSCCYNPPMNDHVLYFVGHSARSSLTLGSRSPETLQPSGPSRSATAARSQVAALSCIDPCEWHLRGPNRKPLTPTTFQVQTEARRVRHLYPSHRGQVRPHALWSQLRRGVSPRSGPSRHARRIALPSHMLLAHDSLRTLRGVHVSRACVFIRRQGP